jgi:hypothetical protein
VNRRERWIAIALGVPVVLLVVAVALLIHGLGGANANLSATSAAAMPPSSTPTFTTTSPTPTVSPTAKASRTPTVGPTSAASAVKPSPSSPSPASSPGPVAQTQPPPPAGTIAPPPKAPASPTPPASMAGVNITMDTYNGAIDTFPRNCATPRVWIDNGSVTTVRAVVVTFQVGILDVAANLQRLGPDTSTGERAAGIPPQSKYSVALKFCIDPKLLPPTLPGNAYPNAVTLARSIVSFTALP